MRTDGSWRMAAWGLAAGLSFAISQPALAHEEGVLQPATRRFPVGGTVEVRGRQFGKNSDLSLVLVGTRGKLRLLEVQTDSLGGFVVDLMISAGTTEGEYRLAAIAADGDQVATVDVVVVAPAPAGAGMEAEHTEHSGAEMAMPSPEPLQLERARSPLVTGLAAGFILVTALGGGLLLRGRRPVV